MAALPPPPGGIPHEHRDIAESFGAEADRYDRTRPHYPRAAADAILDGLPGMRVLDVGIGTGLSALPFRDAGAEVLGVDPDERMARRARARGFRVEVARFEEWDPAGREFDAVIAGQTWHWIDPVAGAAAASTVLRRGGRLAPFWNIADLEPAMAAAFAQMYRDVDTGLPFIPWARPALEAYESILKRVVEGIRTAGAFAEPERLRFDWETVTSKDTWLETVPTMGGHHLIGTDKLAQLVAGLGRVIDEHGGQLTVRYATVAIVAEKTSRLGRGERASSRL